MARGITNQIAKLLSEQNMTQKELAQLTGMTESTISHYMKGDRVPRGGNLVKIAKALGTTTDYLLATEENVHEVDSFETVKTLIARNASNLTEAEKIELVGILVKR